VGRGQDADRAERSGARHRAGELGGRHAAAHPHLRDRELQTKAIEEVHRRFIARSGAARRSGW
jgi:hypothetical protein